MASKLTILTQWLSGNRSGPAKRKVLRATIRVGFESVELPENGSPITLGRDPSNELVMEERAVSAKHAHLKLEDDTVWVYDLESRHGTLINDQPIEPGSWVPLRPRDRLHLAKQEVTLELTLEPEARPFVAEKAWPLGDDGKTNLLQPRDLSDDRKTNLLQPRELSGRTSPTRDLSNQTSGPNWKRAILPGLAMLGLVLLLKSCMGTKLTEERLLGRWVEEKNQRSIEFTEQHLYAMVGNGESVEAGVWAIEGDEVVKTIYAGPRRGEVERWKPELEDDEYFTIGDGAAFFRKFVKLQESGEIFDERLVGVWQSDAENPEVVSFSSRGICIGWAWRLRESGEPFVAGSWAKVSRGAYDFFRLEGFIGDNNISGGRGHAFRFHGDKLAWRKPSDKKEILYRKIKLVDLGPATPIKAATPVTASPTPTSR